MRLYSCKVRLSDSRYNEVRKIGVTAAEIQLLRTIHSLDPENEDVGLEMVDNTVVEDIEFTKEVGRSDQEERARLTELYGPALKRFDGIKNLNGVFGIGVPLPIHVPDEDVKPAPKKRTASRKKETAPATEQTTNVDESLADLA